MAAKLDGVENAVRMMLLRGNGNSPEIQSAAHRLARRAVTAVRNDEMSRSQLRAAAFRYVRHQFFDHNPQSELQHMLECRKALQREVAARSAPERVTMKGK